jgi:fatty acid desaturase
LTAYMWGGTWNHSLFLVIHEISHNLLFETPILNTVFLFVANLPIPVPMAMYVRSPTRVEEDPKRHVFPLLRLFAFSLPPPFHFPIISSLRLTHHMLLYVFLFLLCRDTWQRSKTSSTCAHLFAFLCSLSLLPCSFRSFQKYHRLHHIYLNTFEMDPDLPTQFEGRFFVGPVRKLIWLILQPLTYTIRPLFQQPIPLTRAELVQWVVQFSLDAVIVYYWGWVPLVYLFLATLLGGSLHPMSGHYIGEHYEWAKGYETYSYYGPLNWFGWNVGFHNEHHDFPRVPFTKLPELKKLAPEYYDNLPFHSSWVALMVRFILDPELNPFARRVRIPKGKEGLAAEMTAAARNRDDEGEE